MTIKNPCSNSKQNCLPKKSKTIEASNIDDRIAKVKADIAKEQEVEQPWEAWSTPSDEYP